MYVWLFIRLVLAIVSVNIVYNYSAFELCTVALHHHMLVLIILVSSSTLKAYSLVLLKLVLALASQLYLSVIRSVRLSPVAEISWKKNSLSVKYARFLIILLYIFPYLLQLSLLINHGHYNNSTFS